MKLKTLLLSLVTILLAVSCSDDDKNTNDPSVLPTAAKTLISTYFPNAQIRNIEIEKKGGKKTFDVKLTDLTEIDFDENGNLTDIDCRYSTGRVPDGLILPKILTYVNDNYAGQNIVQYEIKTTGYEIELQSGLDLLFNIQGDFLRIDY